MTYPIIETSELEMEDVIEHFQSDLTTVRTGAANPGMLNRVKVDYYGSPTPLNQIAGISVTEGRTLVVKPYDPSSLKAIEKALNEADLGIAPQNDGTLLRLTVPKMTEDTRRDMTKKVSRMAEDYKVRIRNIRRDANTEVKKDATMDEDVQKDARDEVQKLTDKYIKKIDDLASAKNAELMKV